MTLRARRSFLRKPWPAAPLFWAIVGTQIFAVLMCGFGWFVAQLPWTVIGLIWCYMIVWMFILDAVKLMLYRRFDTEEHRQRPPFYHQFLRGRHPAHSAAS